MGGRSKPTRTVAAASVAAALALLLVACFPYDPDESFGTDGKLELASTSVPVAQPWPLASGGFAQQEFITNNKIRSYGEDGTVLNNWVGGIALGGMDFGGHRPDGDLILFGRRVGFVSYAVTLVVNPITGGFTELIAPWGQTAWPGAADGSPNGRLVSVRSEDEYIQVQTYSAALSPLAGFSTDMTDELGDDCTTTNPVAVTMFDDGSLTVAAGRCSGSTTIGVESVRFLATGELDPAYGGGDGRAVLLATDDGSTPAPLRDVIASDDGSMAVLTQAGTMQRLAPDGSIDATFGLVSLTAPLGDVPASVIADGTGYAASVAPFTGPCTRGPAEVRRFVDNGNHTAKTTLPWSLDGADLARYPDGRLLVSGVSSTLTYVNGSPTCGAPFVPKVARLTLAD